MSNIDTQLEPRKTRLLTVYISIGVALLSLWVARGAWLSPPKDSANDHTLQTQVLRLQEEAREQLARNSELEAEVQAKREEISRLTGRDCSAELAEDAFDLKIVSSNLRLRSQPSRTASSLLTIKRGSAVKVIEDEGGWSRVETYSPSQRKILVGWVSSQYLAEWKSP